MVSSYQHSFPHFADFGFTDLISISSDSKGILAHTSSSKPPSLNCPEEVLRKILQHVSDVPMVLLQNKDSIIFVKGSGGAWEYLFFY